MTKMARVAVLIDSDNITWRAASAILAETARHGTLSIKRAYGDWTSTYLSGWRNELPEHAIQPVQQFAYVAGKNATDSALIIDAMDLLYAGQIDTFCIVSSDSDYTRLAVRLRESGKRVYGIGARNTQKAFQNACDRFTYLDVLFQPATSEMTPSAEDDGAQSPDIPIGAAAHATVPDESSVAVPGDEIVAVPDGRFEPPATIPNAREIVLPAIEASAGDDGWAILASVGWYIVNNNPTFDSRNYGYPKLGHLVRELPDVEVRAVPDANGASHLWVRLADNSAKAGHAMP